MTFRSLADRFPLYAATANSVSARLWSATGASPVPGSQFEYVRICHSGPVLTEFIRRAFPRFHHSGSDHKTQPQHHPRTERLVPVDDPESALRNLEQPGTVSYGWVRDLETIRWKLYKRGETLYAYWTRDSDCLCAFQSSRRGSSGQISALEILDVWGRLNPNDVDDFITCIRQAFNPDMITVRGGTRLSMLDGLVRKFRSRELPCPAVWLMDTHSFLGNRFEFSALAGE
jgi:hypothetical protein